MSQMAIRAGFGALIVTIVVATVAHASSELAIGYDTEEQVRVRATWTDPDALGARWALATRAELSARRLAVDLSTARSLLGTRIEVGITPVAVFEEIYELAGGELQLMVRERLPGGVDLGVGTWLAAYDVTDRSGDMAEIDTDADRAAELRLELSRSPVDDRGAFVSLRGAWAEERFLGDATYRHVAVDAGSYAGLGRNHVVEVRTRLGMGLPHRPTRVLPVWRRHFGGGIADIRSAGRHSLGRLDPKERGVGGEAVAMLIVEAHFLERRRWGFSAFGEASNVWSKLAETRIEGLRLGVGVGVRVDTPIGRARLEVGHKVGARDVRLQRHVWHVSVGEFQLVD